MEKILIKDPPAKGFKETRFSELKERQWYKGFVTYGSTHPTMFMLAGIVTHNGSAAYRSIELEETRNISGQQYLTTKIVVSTPGRIMWDVEPVTLDFVTFVKQG